MKKLLLFFLSLPKTIYFNFKYLNWKIAYKLPIFVSKNVKLKSLKGVLKIDAPITTGMIRIGFNDVSIFDKHYSPSIWDVCGYVVFKGKCSIGHGSKINVGANGILTFGNDFCINAESKIICLKEVTFGDSVLCSWDNLIMDSDFHKIYNKSNNCVNYDESIIISDNVWIGCNSIILKGAIIPKDSVIAAGSLVTNQFQECNTIIAGRPAKPIKYNVTWER